MRHKVVRELESLVNEWVDAEELASLSLSVWRDGAPVYARAFGAVETAAGRVACTPETLFHGYSCGKPLVALRVSEELQARGLTWETPVAELLPWLDPGRLRGMQLHHLAAHEAGLPHAPLRTGDSHDRASRAAQLARWEVRTTPGEAYAYHAESAWWLLAAVLEAWADEDFPVLMRAWIARRFPGMRGGYRPEAEWLPTLATPTPTGEFGQANDADASSQRAYEARLLALSTEELRSIGVPGSGWISTASALAGFYQELLRLRRADDDASRAARALFDVPPCAWVDPSTGAAPGRLRGLVRAGDDLRYLRGFPPNVSEDAFGHNGAGGQIAWADPATGLSFAMLSASLERAPIRAGLRGMQLGDRVTRVFSSHGG